MKLEYMNNGHLTLIEVDTVFIETSGIILPTYRVIGMQRGQRVVLLETKFKHVADGYYKRARKAW